MSCPRPDIYAGIQWRERKEGKEGIREGESWKD